MTTSPSLRSTSTATPIPSYTGSHNLTFSGGTTIGSFTPTRHRTPRAPPMNFGTTTPITFTNGVATVSGSSNGVMTLYKAGAQSITMTDGTLQHDRRLSR